MEDARVAPQASVLLEGLRDVGYDLKTALADIIDNSITAKATKVDLYIDADVPAIGIVDNGIGMDRQELLDAMRHGSRHPRSERGKDDLGRFGLGLKTASLSQCRQLTVVSRRNNTMTAARWDNDYVAQKNDWLVQVLNAEEAYNLPFVGKLSNQGTLVLWQKLDRLSENVASRNLGNHLYQHMEQAEKHIELVFHRFIGGDRPYKKINITVNGSEIIKTDPFNLGHPATQRLPEERISFERHTVRIQPFILPHHKKVSRTEWKRTAGEGDYLANQGFYVYRNGRLIIHSTWFRLAPKTELTKLARVRIDMPSGLDEYWKVDIKKSSAQLPHQIRTRLKKIIDKILESSKKPHTERGAKTFQGDIALLWNRRVDKNQVTYELNREHPSILEFGKILSGTQEGIFTALMRSVENTIPISALYSDIAQRPDQVQQSEIEESEHYKLLRLIVMGYRKSKLSWQNISKALNKVEPFRGNDELIKRVLNELEKEERDA